MNPLSLLFLAFLIVPVVEIYLFIQVGGIIGAPATIAIVFLTAATGAWLFRAQGMSTLARARANMDQGQLPAMELLEGVFLLLSGAFLLTPGFFTDTVGFAFLIPPIRRAIIQIAIRRGSVQFANTRPFTGNSPGTGPGTGPQSGPSYQPPPSPRREGGSTIEGEFRRED